MEYPHFSLHIANEDLIEYFSLTQDEMYLLYQWRKDANTVGFAVLLKSFQFLGYPPRQKEDCAAFKGIDTAAGETVGNTSVNEEDALGAGCYPASR